MGREIHLTPDKNGRIYRYHYKPWKLSKEKLDAGYMIDEDAIPAAPKCKRGEAASLCLKSGMSILSGRGGRKKCKGSEFEWRKYERELTAEEKLDDALERIAALEARLDADG